MNETWWVKPEQLDDDQKDIVTVDRESNHLILGPPGSGKTNLLLLRANYLHRAGSKNILILVFTRALQDFINTGGARYSFDASKIMTSNAWARNFLWAHGVKPTLPTDFIEQRRALLANVGEVIERENLGRPYEVTLLDEAQDYWPEEVTIFHRLSKRIFAVADSRQKIYRGDDALGTIESFPAKVHRLRFHYRNGLKICRLADAIAKDATTWDPLTPTSNYDESARPSSVEVNKGLNLEAQAHHIARAIEVQLKAYPDELIGILCPGHSELDAMWQIISETGISGEVALETSGSYGQLGERRVCMTTIHSAKGLEFRAVHIAGCDRLRKFPHQRNVVYTAITRAKTSLALYYEQTIPAFLEQAIASLGPAVAPPRVEDLFT